MKITWGKGIAIAMIAFMTFILYMVITLMSKKTDLESEDYYKKEIEFDKEINAITNTNKLKEKVKISQNEDFVVLQFPLIKSIDSIKVLMFRPDNDEDDQTFEIKDSKMLMIPNKKLKLGIYEMKIQFKIENELYMQKESIVIKKNN
jgi:hypothetical protein